VVGTNVAEREWVDVRVVVRVPAITGNAVIEAVIGSAVGQATSIANPISRDLSEIALRVGAAGLDRTFIDTRYALDDVRVRVVP
jgi:hypothetical protein